MTNRVRMCYALTKEDKKMREAIKLQEQIDKVKSKLDECGIEYDDYDAAIECLSKTVAPVYCIRIYEEFINY